MALSEVRSPGASTSSCTGFWRPADAIPPFVCRFALLVDLAHVTAHSGFEGRVGTIYLDAFSWNDLSSLKAAIRKMLEETGDWWGQSEKGVVEMVSNSVCHLIDGGALLRNFPVVLCLPQQLAAHRHSARD